ncbi:recombinase family protein [Ensifer sp. ENS02]|uniref:recombinase family protein n=1 Tax=Ensifer sp. ENS02 TaxID=2769290 RepID=UPI00177AEC05|nr:recombinase family protein [Ensifer sp. ENS02]MBD9522782.1 recombinase family protein [Ensifer sp. ENS02]
MKRGVLYARYSTDLQRPESVEDQFRVCRDLMKREEWAEVGTYHDSAISGSSLILRPGIRQLMLDARRGKFDIVVAEALDRISRDQADLANLYKHLKFENVSIYTLSEGDVTELHVGMKGAMNAIFITDLAAKVRRGVRGRVEAGKSGGGNCYGYKVVRQFSSNGDVICGEREIIAEEASIIRRIFREFAAGASPRAIAAQLNRDGIPGPRGEYWTDGTIRGQQGRGTGLLNNELYVGRRIWNRLRYIKDPDTGKRVSRKNPQSAWIVSEVPELRIVDDSLWHAVKERQKQVAARFANVIASVRGFHAKNRLNLARRPKSLLSGLIYCGCCGGSYSIRGADRFACSNHVNRRSCPNGHGIQRKALERRVLIGVKDRLMEQGALAEALRAYADESDRLDQERRVHSEGWKSELTKVSRQIEHMVDAIADGMNHPSLKEKLTSLEDRKKELIERLDDVEVLYAIPKIPPDASAIYASKVEHLLEALNQLEERSSAKEAIRNLIEKIIVTPGPGRGEVDAVMYGDLGTVLEWLGSQPDGNATQIADGRSPYPAMSESVVAGAGFEPAAFRL